MGGKGLREKILACDDAQKEIVDVPEWGVELEVRSITGKQRNDIYSGAAATKEGVDLTVVYGKLLVAAVYDPNTGNSVFKKGDGPKLMDKSGGALARVLEAAQRLGGLGPRAIEETEKN